MTPIIAVHNRQPEIKSRHILTKFFLIISSIDAFFLFFYVILTLRMNITFSNCPLFLPFKSFFLPEDVRKDVGLCFYSDM